LTRDVKASTIEPEGDPVAKAKRPPPKGPDRPILRTSHGTPHGPQRRGSAEGAAEAPRPAARAPRRTGRASAAGAHAAPRRDEETPTKLKKAKAAGPVLSSASDEAREVALQVAIAAIEKKASGLEVIDVAGKVDYADFLVLMSGRSDRHVAALAAGIEEALRKHNKRALAVEGLPHANWVLMDFGDVVVHVFQDDARAAYDLDSLWMDARRVPVPISDEPAR
jgi:ribosome-associated protein